MKTVFSYLNMIHFYVILEIELISIVIHRVEFYKRGDVCVHFVETSMFERTKHVKMYIFGEL